MWAGCALCRGPLDSPVCFMPTFKKGWKEEEDKSLSPEHTMMLWRG